MKEAKDKLALAEKDYEKYQSNPKTQPDFEGEDSAKKVWESEKKVLEESVQNAEYGREDALTGNGDNLREADRKLEDANTPNRATVPYLICHPVPLPDIHSSVPPPLPDVGLQ